MTERYREEGMGLINMGLLDLLIRKTLPPFYQAAFNSKWVAIEVSYFGAREPFGGRITDPELLGLRMFIEEDNDLKEDKVDSTALFSPRNCRRLAGTKSAS